MISSVQVDTCSFGDDKLYSLVYWYQSVSYCNAKLILLYVRGPNCNSHFLFDCTMTSELSSHSKVIPLPSYFSPYARASIAVTATGKSYVIERFIEIMTKKNI